MVLGQVKLLEATSLSKLVMRLPFSHRFKGAVPSYQGKGYADRWGLNDDLGKVAQR